MKDNKLKITPRRREVIALFKSRGRLMRPYDVYEELKRRLATIGLPTVYRILNEFSRIGILEQSLSDDRQLCYVLCASPGSHRHYFACRKCYKVMELGCCGIKGISQVLEKRLHAKVERHMLRVEGLCSECR